MDYSPSLLDWRQSRPHSMQTSSNWADDDDRSRYWCQFFQMSWQTLDGRLYHECNNQTPHYWECDFFVASLVSHHVRRLQRPYSIEYHCGSSHARIWVRWWLHCIDEPAKIDLKLLKMIFHYVRMSKSLYDNYVTKEFNGTAWLSIFGQFTPTALFTGTECKWHTWWYQWKN